MRARASSSWSATSRTSCRPTRPADEYHGTRAALEFAVQALRVKHIVVLGHARCGGIRAFADESRAALARRLHRQLDDADRARGGAPRPARRATSTPISARLELAAIEQQPRQPHDLSVRAHPRASAGGSTLHGAYFGVATGVLMVRDPKTGAFAPGDGGRAGARVGDQGGRGLEPIPLAWDRLSSLLCRIV